MKIQNLKPTRCKTAYPLVFVHGMARQDNKIHNSWGRIPRFLRDRGAQVFYGDTEAFAPIKDNAEILCKRIDAILKETGAKKVNIIAYSKGGLDTRYAISTLKIGAKVASLTTVATPHHGSEGLDFYCRFPRFLQKFIAFFPNAFAIITGERKFNFFKVVHELSAKEAVKFNAQNPDEHGVYYQSYAALMKNAFSDITMCLNYLIIYLFEGPNDGLLSPKSVKWTNFRGIITSSGKRGVSHNDGCDFFERGRFSKKKSNDGYSDICDFYADLAEGLKKENC